jgi:hypothetical protein
MTSTPRGPNRFRKSELTRILRAGRSAGAKHARVVFKDGKIVANFDFSVDTASAGEANDRNEWDDELFNGNDQASLR